MKVNFKGPIYQDDGWGKAANAYFDSLIPFCDIRYENVTMGKLCRHMRAIGKHGLEGFHKGPEVYIQNVLPPMFRKTGAFDVGICYTETMNFEGLNWVECINENLDMLIVPTSVEFNNLRKSGVEIPIEVIEIPVDFSYYDKYKTEGKDEAFTFYTIGENIERKNFKDLVTAFVAAFEPEDNVELIIKTNNTDYPGLLGWAEILKSGMSDKVTIITNRLSYDNLCKLHDQFHCFVSASYGESTCLPLIEAMAFGNPCIVTGATGMSNFSYMEYSISPIQSYSTPCVCLRPPIKNLYNINQRWKQIDIAMLSEYMKKHKEWYKGTVDFPYAREQHDPKRVGDTIVKTIRQYYSM